MVREPVLIAKTGSRVDTLQRGSDAQQDEDGHEDGEDREGEEEWHVGVL